MNVPAGGRGQSPCGKISTKCYEVIESKVCKHVINSFLHVLIGHTLLIYAVVTTRAGRNPSDRRWSVLGAILLKPAVFKAWFRGVVVACCLRE